MKMTLTNTKAWHVYAGGTSAASDKHGYDAYTTLGRYMIQPCSHPHNVELHIGYKVTFCNEKGALTGGLYQPIVDYKTSLPHARKLCQEHMVKHSGELVAEQIPGSAGTPA